MKKLIIILFFLTLFINVKIYGFQTLIITENVGSDEILEEEGHQIIENNVDWTRSGKYEVEYFNPTSRQFFSKEVVVTSSEQLENGLSDFLVDTIQTKAVVSNILYVNENEYFIYGAINDGYYPYQGNYNQEFAYIAFYQNNRIQWTKRINDLRYGVIKDACLTAHGAAFIGDYDSEDEGRNIFILEISLSGIILYEKEFKGYQDDFGHKLFINDNRLYFVGETFSSDHDFLYFTDNDSNIIAGYVSLVQDDDYEMIALGNKENDVFKDAVFHNQILYIYMQFNGTGYFQQDFNITSYEALISIDYRLTINEYISIDKYNPLNGAKLSVVNDAICLVKGCYTSNRLTFFMFDAHLGYLHNVTFSVDYNRIISDFKIIENENLVIIICFAYDNLGQKYHIVSFLNRDLYKISSYSNKTSYYKLLNAFQDQNQKIIFSSWNLDSQTVDVVKYQNIQLFETKYIDDNKIFYERTLKINNEWVDYQLYLDNVGNNPFGAYTNLYRFISMDTVIIIDMDMYFFPKTNIVSKETYDLGLCLQFNGKGYLNDELITTGKMINQEGNYVLQLIGNSNETEVFTFKVKPLSENAPLEVSETCSYDIELMNSADSEKPHESNKVNLTNNLFENDEINTLPFIYLGVILLGLVFGIIIPRKKGIKNV